MEANWKLVNGWLFYRQSDEWKKAAAGEVFSSAFSGADPGKTENEGKTVREVFPQLRFSRFAVKPELILHMVNSEISVQCVFNKKGKQVQVNLPLRGTPEYVITDDTWYYFSGEYQQAVELLEQAHIDNEKISFQQYVALLTSAAQYDGLSIKDNVKDELDVAVQSHPISQPAELKATLYPYQKIGYKWLKYITDGECGCILGDEMGLGKTIQIISLLVERNAIKKAPYLVVAPLSLLENWKREINRFAPEIDVFVHHGSKRTGRFTDLMQHDVIITSYGTTITDLSLFEMIKWDLLVLDEAQNIKNPAASRTVSVKQIPCRASVAVTGTPFENHMTDLWSLLDFVIPGCVGTLDHFRSVYPDDLYGAEKIEPLLTAMMLRRQVADVAKDLPEKVIIPQALVMDSPEALEYDRARQAIASMINSSAVSLALLTKLRMYCTHPYLVQKEINCSDPCKYSSKYTRFCEIVEEIVARHEKVIVFTSYSEMFDIFRQDIPGRFRIPVDCINGETPASKRQQIVDLFSHIEGSAMLILNPKAAGVGLNITAANHVIHYNLEWNPALEDQATARSFRRGQSRTVFVYRLFYSNTVEEVVNEKIINKRALFDAAVVGSEGTEDTRSLIMKALMMSPV